MIVAEICQNWKTLEEAKRMIAEATIAGTDLCKFQLFDSEKLYGEKIPQELNYNQAKQLFDYGKAEGIEVFFSVFDVERVKWCESIGVKRYKVAYSMTSPDVFRAILDTRKLVYVSGDFYLAFSGEIKELYCDGEYPSNPIPDWVDFKVFYGYSDHSIGLDQCKIAIDRGARLIEKHFCLAHDRGVDAEWSMTPGELRGLVEYDKRNPKD